MQRLGSVLALLCAIGMAAPERAAAAKIQLDFLGVIDQIPSELDAHFQLAAPVSGSLVLDTATPDSNPSSEFGEYVGTPTDVSFHFDELAWTADGGGPGDSTLLWLQPGQHTISTNTLSPVGPVLDGWAASNLIWRAIDPSGTAFPDDSFPTLLPADDFGSSQAQISFQKTGLGAVAVFATVSFTAPEPGGAAAAAIAALAALRCARQASRTL